jgi:hypothetical protein
MASIKGGKVKNIATLKSSMKKGGGSGYLSRVPADGTLTVRFLTEPTEWIMYYECYDAVRKFYPLTDDCVECIEGDRPSVRYLANVVDISESRVIPLVMPKSMAASILKKYEKYATLLDRDYELSRTGTGLDTEYDVTPEPPTKMNFDRFDLIDLMEILEGQLQMANGASSDEDEDEDIKPRSRSTRKAAPSASNDVDDDESDDDDLDEDESEGGEDYWTRDQLEGKSLRELKQIALDLEWGQADVKGLDVDGLIDLIVGDWSDEDSDESDDDDDEIIEDDEDIEDEDEDAGELTEEELRAMSLAEIKKLAREMGVRFKPGTSKDDIVELILDAAGEDDGSDDEEVPF